MATDTRMPTVLTSSWGASVTHRIVLTDGRVVFLHYDLNSRMPEEAGYVLTSISVHVPNTDHRGTESYSLADLGALTYDNPEHVPDELPEWLRYLVQNFPEPTPIAKD